MDGNYLSRNNYKHSLLNKNSILTFKTNFLYSPYSYSKEEIDRDFNQPSIQPKPTTFTNTSIFQFYYHSTLK